MSNDFTLKEKATLRRFEKQMRDGELAQFLDLDQNCDISYQYAKTYTVYVNDWKKTKAQMEAAIDNNTIPDRPEVARELINIGDKIISEKLKLVEQGFRRKFNESIFNYIKEDGTTNSNSGCIAVIIAIIAIILYFVLR